MEEAVEEPRIRSELLVSSEWLAERLDDPEVIVLHVGTSRDDYERGHVPGARFVELATLVTEREGVTNELPPITRLDSVFEAAGVSDRSRVVIYGAPLAAARAFFTLDYLGHGDRAALLDGGLPGWRMEGRPTSTARSEPIRGSLAPRPQPERVVEAEWVREHLDDSEVALLDARPMAQFAGADPAGLPRPGHIPGAGNLFWEEMLRSTDPLVLHDPGTLRKMFRAAGVNPGDTVVTYCRTGMQASFTYFVARYLGYDTRMYDASYMEWSRRPELPVER